MNDTEEKFLFTEYRSPCLNLGVIALAISLLSLGFVPDMFDLGGQVFAGFTAVLGLVLAGFVVWTSQCLLATDRALAFEEDEIVELVCFTKWFEWTRTWVLASFEDVESVHVEQRFNLGSRYNNWTYPVVLHLCDGQRITLSNRCRTQNRENYSLPMAEMISERLGCELFYSEDPQSAEAASGYSFHMGH